ncbi:Hint domain-containing protein [Mangrovicoccus algicola]|nr:Hint domain-containing protein [Mangrovicoccus algicola]
MATLTYTYLYTWDIDSDQLVAVASASGGYTIEQTVDGNGDGTDMISTGEFLTVNGDAGDNEYVGRALYQDGGGTISADGVVFTSAGVQYYASNEEIAINGGANTAPVIATVDLVVCFAAGTLIATPDGETKVESLEIGDLVMTPEGKSVPVKWVGRKTVMKFFQGERARPVRVSAGALGDGVPHRDLVLTADHALIIDGLAINAGALVNGTTISFDPLQSLPERVTYFHVETDAHDIILANGAAAETYVDYIGRQAFDNAGEYLSLYGEERDIPEMALPRVSTARLVPPAIRARIQGKLSA